MAFSKVKVGGLADDSVTAANIDDDGTGYTVGNLTNSGTLQQTGQATFGSGGTNWSLPTSRGTDKYVLQINGTTGAADWAESLTAPEISGHNFDVSGSTDDGGINAYEAPYEYTGTTNQTTTISALSSTTGLLAGQYISGAGIPADTTIVSVDSGANTMVISNAVTVAGTQTEVALKIQKTPGEKNGGKVTITGANFGATIGELTVAITNSSGSVIANASYLSGLSGGNTITAEWTGTEGTYSTDLTSSYVGSIYFKITKSGLSSNVLNTNTTLTSDPAVTALSGSSQTGGDVFTDPSATSLGAYGSGRVAGGGQDSNTKLLLNFDRTGGTDIEDSSNRGGDGHKVTATNAVIKASPFGDGKSAIYFDGVDDKLNLADSPDWDLAGADFTIEWWMYVEDVPADSARIMSTSATDSSGIIAFLQANGNLGFAMGNGSSWQHIVELGSGSVIDKKWYHVAIVHDHSAMTSNLYLDGKSGVPDSTGTITNNNVDRLVIGHWEISGVGSAKYFNGYIDDFRIVKGVAVYTGNFTVPTSRLSTTWAANPYGGSNTVANSTAGNTKLLIHSEKDLETSDSNHLITHASGVTYNTTSPKWTNRSAMYFDGSSGSEIRIPQSDDFDFGTGAFTIRGWVKPSSASGNEVIFSTTEWNGNDNADGTALMLRKSGSKWYINATNTSHSGWALETASSSDVTTSWQHFVVTKASGTAPVKLIIDGTTEVTTSNITSIASTSGFTYKDFIIGKYRNGQQFTGYISDFEVLKGENTETSPINSETTKSTNTKLLLLGTTAGLFTDSSDSNHTITPTGSYHRQDHGGIATALAWPANGKATGSAGVFFDGTTDYLTTELTPVIGTGQFTLDFWMWPYYQTDSPIIVDTRTSSNTYGFMVQLEPSGRMRFYASHDSGGNAFDFTTPDNANGKITFRSWNHIAVERNSGNQCSIYLNGIRHIAAANNSFDCSEATLHLGIIFSLAAGWSYHGYLDNFRRSGIARYDTADFSSSLPTRIYGAYGQDTPDVGTITLTATGDGDFTWSEMSQGTALPGTLAVGSTAHSGSGNSRTHTATITGTLPVNTSTTYTNGVKGDIATSNILLKVQHDTDATKAVTLNETTGMSITQKSTEKPVLFNVRRYKGNQTNREISGYGFAPDFVWIKNRDTAINHCLFDSVRGATKQIDANTTGAETTQATMLTSFNKDGFSHGTDTAGNKTDDGHMAWAWKAGGAPSATGKSAKLQNEILSEDTISTTFNTGTDSYNTASGHVTSVTRSVNVDGGFSIVKYVNNGSGNNRAIPHGLGSKPDMIILKPLIANSEWLVYHQGLTSNDDLNAKFIKISSSDGETGLANGSTSAATDYHFYTPDSNAYDLNTTDSVGVIAYCWKDVPNVSKFGSYVGNANNNSVTVGFKPKFLIIKRYNSTGSWSMWDYIRNPSGDDMQPFYANGNSVEGSVDSTFTPTLTNTGFSFDSNVTHASLNGDGQNYIYMAWA